MNWTPRLLQAFENEIEQIFASGAIKAPVHFAGGNESQLIEIFKDIKTYDWILCSWRSHLHCLLRGVSPESVKDAIIRGRSIALCFPRYRILSSALVGGICPIAVGLAFAIKQRRGRETVHAFIGDMTSYTGIYQECHRYCLGHDLPVHWVVEDNGLSVMTNTEESWGYLGPHIQKSVDGYKYKLTWPHVGIGKWVSF
jgi:TPP-dependent pyruvate/acetoin dehydrogenase alpha subunit